MNFPLGDYFKCSFFFISCIFFSTFYFTYFLFVEKVYRGLCYISNFVHFLIIALFSKKKTEEIRLMESEI